MTYANSSRGFLTSSVLRRYELTDRQWDVIAGIFLNNEGKDGLQWNHHHRRTIDGNFWILCSGAAWRDLLERYGAWKSVYDRFRR